MTAALVAVVALLAVLLTMAGEAALSAFNERVLRQRGAVAPPGDWYETTRWAYPLSFVLMALEGAWSGPASPDVLSAGLVLFALSKALKLWAISTLGVRWTFRLLVLPGAPLITHGPYALLRHPNYVAVIGELVAMALIVRAPVMGIIATAAYAVLLRRRAAAEDRALGRQ